MGKYSGTSKKTKRQDGAQVSACMEEFLRIAKKAGLEPMEGSAGTWDFISPGRTTRIAFTIANNSIKTRKELEAACIAHEKDGIVPPGH